MSEVPEGFHRLRVYLSTAELERLKATRPPALQPRGTWSETIREEMGLSASPHGFIKAQKEKRGE